MFCCPVTADEIVRIINNFPNNKAPGIDNINPKLLKRIVDAIIEPLAHIFNLSFTNGSVPDLLKIAKVVPIYKKEKKTFPAIIDPYRY